jgi:DNA-binding LacI/PurR family transcriptional regulator
VKKAAKKVKKKMGRPATGRDPAITIRIPPETLARVMRWAKKHNYNRSVAVVGLVERGLKSCGEPVEE